MAVFQPPAAACRFMVFLSPLVLPYRPAAALASFDLLEYFPEK
jgi:hypothetical protein